MSEFTRNKWKGSSLKYEIAKKFNKEKLIDKNNNCPTISTNFFFLNKTKNNAVDWWNYEFW